MNGTPASSARWAAWTFGALVAAALVLYVAVGRDQWFFADEWDYLANRNILSDPADLLRPHNDHLHILPIIVLRAWWHLFHLSSYLPYQLMVIVLHLASAALLRAVVRGAGVGPWIATAAASVFLFLGSGAENIVFAVQITFVGSLAFGLGQLLLAADRDGPLDLRSWRDWAALGAGLVAIGCSGIGVAMVAVTGMATLARRGWRAAAFQVLPLAVLYLTWWISFGRGQLRSGGPGTVVGFVVQGFDAAFDSMAQLRWLGGVLILIAVVGLILAWSSMSSDELRRRAAVPAAMLVGAALFLVSSAMGRAGVFGAESARETRYFPVVVALVLPALAVAVDALWRRWKPIGALAFIAMLVGIPYNLAELDQLEGRAEHIAAARELLLTLPRVPAAAGAPDDLHPAPEWFNAPEVTMRWLRQGLDEGWLPDPGPLDDALVAAATFRLSLYQLDAALPSDMTCTQPDGSVPHRLDTGEHLFIDGGFVRISASGPGATPEQFIIFNPNRGHVIELIGPPTEVTLQSAGRNGPAKLCTARLDAQHELR